MCSCSCLRLGAWISVNVIVRSCAIALTKPWQSHAGNERDYFSSGSPGQCAYKICSGEELFGRYVVDNAWDATRTNADWSHKQARAGIGVNLGGWLVLEDWFFSDAAPTEDNQDVGSKEDAGEGRDFPSKCSSPTAQFKGISWKSEGDLTTQLKRNHASGQGPDPVALFALHRETYVTEEDFKQIAELKIKKVRMPIPWQTFADALCNPGDNTFDQYCGYDPENSTVIIQDPFYRRDMNLVTVPRKILRQALHWAQIHGLQIIFDVHTMPGGSSAGSYSSVWPLTPAFWNETVGHITLRSLGLSITAKLLDWSAKLGSLKDAVGGFSFLNEPAMHADGGETMGGEGWLHSQDDVFDWLADASSLYEDSRRHFNPDTKVYVNMHQSAFADGVHAATRWFKDEYLKKDWAVLDIHFYVAWETPSPACDAAGTDDMIQKTKTFMERTWLSNPVLSGTDLAGRMAVTEFSAATFHKVSRACRDVRFLRSFLHRQAAIMIEHGVEPFFWTWRMPEGGIFQDGWSLKKIAGYEDDADGRFCS